MREEKEGKKEGKRVLHAQIILFFQAKETKK